MSQFDRLLEEAGLTDACYELECEAPGSIDKFLYRSSDQLQIEAIDWSFESDVFVSDQGLPLSDHQPVAVEFSWMERD